MSKREIYWHLPGFCYYYCLNQILIQLMKDHPELFREGYRIGSVYGTFPGAIWNGGRAVFGITSKEDITRIIGTYDKLATPVRFTWTNSVLEECHLNDTYCNMIMRIADNGRNQVLVNTEVLENYLRAEYPGYKFISSTTKRITDPGQLKEELERNYELVVLDYDLNHDESVLRSLEPAADRIEILVDEICFPNCPHRAEHYRDESRAQLEYEKLTSFRCPNRTTKPAFKECMKRPAFISADAVESYAERGFVNFKLVGRGLPMSLVIDSYVYYLAREESQDDVRDRIMRSLAACMSPEMIKRMG